MPYTHTSNPLCERQNRVVEQNLRILMKQERTKDWVRLVPWAVLSMNSQRSSSTGFTPHELFHGGRPAWFFKTPFPEDFKSPVGDWLEHKQFLANQAGTNLRHIRDRDRADGTAYGDLPASRLVTLFWYTIHAYPPGHVTACRTLTLDPIVSSG